MSPGTIRLIIFFAVVQAANVAAEQSACPPVRYLQYSGGEALIYVVARQPTVLVLPDAIASGWKARVSALALQREDNQLIIFGKPTLDGDGEALVVRLANRNPIVFRFQLENAEHRASPLVIVEDKRSETWLYESAKHR